MLKFKITETTDFNRMKYLCFYPNKLSLVCSDRVNQIFTQSCCMQNLALDAYGTLLLVPNCFLDVYILSLMINQNILEFFANRYIN